MPPVTSTCPSRFVCATRCVKLEPAVHMPIVRTSWPPTTSTSPITETASASHQPAFHDGAAIASTTNSAVASTTARW